MWVHTAVSVGTSDGQLRPVQSDRRSMIIQNIDATDNAFITLSGDAAVVDEGIRVAPGETYLFSQENGFATGDELRAITDGIAAITLLVTEKVV